MFKVVKSFTTRQSRFSIGDDLHKSVELAPHDRTDLVDRQFLKKPAEAQNKRAALKRRTSQS